MQRPEEVFDDDTDDLGPLLRSHLTSTLDGQLGRAAKAFAQHQAARPAPVSGRNVVIRMIAAAGGLAAAAVIGLAVMTSRVAAPAGPGPVAVNSNENATPSDVDGKLEEVVWSRTIDAGTVFLDDSTPARKLVREQVRELRWTDASGTRHISAAKPQQDVMLISLETY